ncbi:MAG: glutathione S-transferase family protein [Candidatus Binataceae bacterium]
MLRLYDYLPSGNGYKVRLLLTQLGIAFQRIEVAIFQGESRTAQFLAKFPNGRIPAIEFDDGRTLFESNAIMSYFADGTRFLPTGGFERAQVLQWMFFEQYSHEPNIATLRSWLHYAGLNDERRAVLEAKRKLGYDALGVMELHLKNRNWFVGERYSIADIALYAYTHVADEGGFEMSRFPAIQMWLDRVRAQPGHIPITLG